ncbi:hypothetical protein AKO1_012513 [Acrasis kona]|uniref:Uncharacterized protein n=1 Tax=Acrasis kona TaxID=1008807 RepID=A0AAW2YWS0_9EUKA
MTDTLEGISTTNNGTHLSIIGRDLESIPTDLASQFGEGITELHLNHNNIKRVQHLERFSKLKSLVLDNNDVEDISDAPQLKELETFWINSNNVSDLDAFLNIIERRFPNLKWLSLLKNPACPSELTSHDTDDYQRHRLYVLYKLKNLKQLKYLDSKEVSAAERKEAETRGSFCKVMVATPTQSPEQDNVPVIENVSQVSQSKKPQASSFFGYTKHVYTGKHSEGNRFIKNNDL